MIHRPFSVTASIILVLLNALVWLFFAALVALDLHPALPESSTVRWLMGIFAFGCAMTLIGLVVLLGKRVRIAYAPMMGLLALLIVLTIADDVGWVDLAYLFLASTPLVLMIKDRSWYTTRGR